MKIMRLVVAGAPGSGKSTFVRTISEVEVIETERSATDHTSLLKKKTTVAFDYGRFTFGSSLEMQIYGTPGQSRFNFMWDYLIKNAQSYIVLVAAHRPNDFHYARHIISYMNQRVGIPMIIGLTHTDCPGVCSTEEIMTKLGYMNQKNRPSVMNVNPNERGSIIEVLMACMTLVVERSGRNQYRRGGY
ncbi:GTP-binding protein [Allocoleopsis franciscana]|uniref:Putative GTPase n=1 Tax=Allocoleopsis franciscana PCC 7113 TaxID=1173027 RepID=K9WF44_9CYAN|nr:ATP/GTP-binding protein [Allocoleopsis franciscana]AFZ18117.1 putative GTPase [Allocoleopsis franciscana PCC 7113]